MKILHADRKTALAGDYFSLNFGNVKKAFLPADSVSPYRMVEGLEIWALPFVLKDNAMAVSQAALQGPDLWVDPLLHKALFISDRLGKALKAAGAGRAFGLKKCRVI